MNMMHLLERYGSPWMPPETIAALKEMTAPGTRASSLRRSLANSICVAERGRFNARPNPVVGAMIGESVGWHQAYGGAHAERNLLSDSSILLEGRTMYVSLEPCAHSGKQPPCTGLLLTSGVETVVWAANDSNPSTAGRAKEILEEAGITCEAEPDAQLAEIARRQNIGFHLWNTKGRPAVHGKWAVSKNLRVSTGDGSKPWISGDASRQLVHAWRAGVGAVVVGAGTVISDDPELTVRPTESFDLLHAPIRVVMDRGLKLAFGSRLLGTASPVKPVLVMTSPESTKTEKTSRLNALSGVTVFGCSTILEGLEYLGGLGVRDVLLESGPTLAEAFSQAGLIDTISIFKSGDTYDDYLPGFSPDSFLAKAAAHCTWESIGNDEYVIL